jgi:hypothetical protein
MQNLLIGILLLISTNVFATKPEGCDETLESNLILCKYNNYKKELMVLEVVLQKNTTYSIVGDTVHLKNASMGTLNLTTLEDTVQLLQFGDSVLISKLEPSISLKKVKKELGKLLIVYSNK